MYHGRWGLCVFLLFPQLFDVLFVFWVFCCIHGWAVVAFFEFFFHFAFVLIFHMCLLSAGGIRICYFTVFKQLSTEKMQRYCLLIEKDTFCSRSLFQRYSILRIIVCLQGNIQAFLHRKWYTARLGQNMLERLTYFYSYFSPSCYS